MARILAALTLFAVIAYGVWPYYTIFRLDTALGEPDPESIAPFIDLVSIQDHYKQGLGAAVDDLVPRDQRDGEPLMDWLADGLQRLGDSALEQAVTVELVRGLLREAAARATDRRPAYFMAGIQRAFFTSWNRFSIRLGPSDHQTLVVMTLSTSGWRVTEIRRPGPVYRLSR